MQKFRKFFLIPSLIVSVTVISCEKQVPYNAYTYNHYFDNLKITEIKTQKSKYNYKDYDKNSFYTEMRYPISYSPSLGDVNFLVVPVWFTDSTDFIKETHRELVRSDIEATYLGNEEDVGWESVKTYYEKDSFGNLHIGGTVTEWYECGKSASEFYTSSGNTQTLLVNAVKWAKEKYGNLTEYDADKDGFLDSVILIYGAPEYNGLVSTYGGNYGKYSNMWAYTSFLGSTRHKKVSSPGPNTFFWASYDFMYSWGEADSRTGKSDCGLGDTRYATLDSHTFIHETGHLFGLDDYYDYAGGMSASLGFSMQDENVGGHDPFSRFALGWADAIIPTKTSKIRLKPMESSGEVILLSNSCTNNPFDEYFLVELYTPTGLNEFDTLHMYRNGYPTGPQKAGIRLWHVDSRLFTVTKYTSYDYTGKVTTKIEDGSILFATNNTSTTEAGGLDLAGSIKYNKLQTVRRDYFIYDEKGNIVNPSQPSRIYNSLLERDLFVTGDYFTMDQYRIQFANTYSLNSKKKFKWSIYFDEVTSEGATITVIKR